MSTSTQPGFKVFVGNVPQGTIDKELRDLFETYGLVSEIYLPKRKGYESIGQLQGFAFVTFSDEAAANQVIRLGSIHFKGSELRLSNAVRKAPSSSSNSGPDYSVQSSSSSLSSGGSSNSSVSNRIFCGGFTSDISADMLRNHFSQFGQVLDCHIPKSSNAGARRYCFISFADKDGVTRALNYTDHKVNGVSLTVNSASPKQNSGSSNGQQGGKQMGNNMNNMAMMPPMMNPMMGMPPMMNPMMNPMMQQQIMQMQKMQMMAPMGAGGMNPMMGPAGGMNPMMGPGMMSPMPGMMGPAPMMGPGGMNPAGFGFNGQGAPTMGMPNDQPFGGAMHGMPAGAAVANDQSGFWNQANWSQSWQQGMPNGGMPESGQMASRESSYAPVSSNGAGSSRYAPY